ncbi:MAG TPA: hypothetical protein VGS22_05815 [Thermoanaerobaculia bacterium]|jgi:hypothetical protein|nr:hypothetical protein [Thermoanaerobaculia bacterium]
MGDKSYAAKIDRWQSTVNNLAAAIHAIPEADQVYAEVKEMVDDLAQAHATLVQMEGRRKEIVRVRRQLSLETERLMRRLASITRGHLGFGNPVLETFGIRAEDWSRRRKGKRAPKTETPPA